MPRLSEHDRSGAFGMLKDGVRVSDVARYNNCHPSTIQLLRDLYQVIGQLKIDAGLVSQEWGLALRGNLVDCVSTIHVFTSTISVPAG